MLSVLVWKSGNRPSHPLALVVLPLVGLISNRGPRVALTRQYALSVRAVLILAAVPLVGPVGAGLVGVLNVTLDVRRGHVTARVFNSGMFGLLGLVGGLVYLGAGGIPQPTDGTQRLVAGIAVPLAAAIVAMCLLNAVLVAMMMRISSGARMRSSAVDMLAGTGVVYVAYGLLGILCFVLWVPIDLGPVAAVMMIPPLWAAGWVFAQVQDLFRAQEQLVAGVLAGLDARRPGAAAHGQAVSNLAAKIADEMRLNVRTVREFRIAGALHDVAALFTTTTSDGQVAVQTLLGPVSFLGPTLPGVLQVRENFDGSGYPEGRAGVGISLVARGVAVADAYALAFERAKANGSSDQAARTAALARMRMHSERRFDPDLIAALEAAVSRGEPNQHRAEQPGKATAQ